MDDDTYTVQRAYPQIYLACHVEHRQRGASGTGLTSRDATILAHIAPGGTGPAELARHLAVSPSTLSAALKRLAGLRLIILDHDPADARRRLVGLTRIGREAVAEGSVLDAGRVAALLQTLTSEERRQAVEGLALLGEAARRYQDRI